ncbi:hypothetical protein Tco_1505766 [Tanacetum coccineum]
MAIRVRRRKISEKTMEPGMLFPGGHRMTKADMFQAAFKSVLQHIGSSPGLGGELQTLITNPTIQVKLYTAGKCVVTEELGKILTVQTTKGRNTTYSLSDRTSSSYYKRDVLEEPFEITWPLPFNMNPDSVSAEFL